ncbi:MAG: class I SAM-dependent methyltransferase [Bacteroidia bacterium]|nr:class I SAM-dependent methyltransferase [Bacteroidia bacterium]
MQTQSSSDDIQSTIKLQARLNANQHASRDFDEWCFRQLPELSLDPMVLDIGCGTGKQILLFSPVFSKKSCFYGLDLSGESLKKLRQTYHSPPSLHLTEGSFDELEKFPHLQPASFDLIYVSYALYYTKDLSHVIREVYKLLKPGGIFWVITPYSGTNAEFLQIIRPLHEVEPFMDYVFDVFWGEVVEKAVDAGFSTLKPSMFRNKIPFYTGADFLTYLQNSLFYRPGFDAEITEAVNSICQQEGRFEISKNVISLQLRK